MRALTRSTLNGAILESAMEQSVLGIETLQRCATEEYEFGTWPYLDCQRRERMLSGPIDGASE